MNFLNLRICLVASLILAVLVPHVFAMQAERERIDVSARGPQVGELIPDFSLEDQYGRVWTRDSVLGRNGTMLVFLRSADW